ncbi:MAG: hypothetical protein HC840_22050 [Leptolyngbyaceae cyanobacterium RM2_2_4]|nr:hypothetical protein [Leptolyngbyaceae cyanobacterium SM1_4_3]NJO51655.1 hypothetical protein [Leptolyngbyaceae cyanobacterium RM2_2_4]
MDWQSLFNLIEIHRFFLVQTPARLPSSPTGADIELLQSQLEFLKQSYSQFIDTVKIIFTILGVAGVIVAYFFGKSFKDFQDAARKDVRDFQEIARRDVQESLQQVRQEAEAQIPRLVEAEVARLVEAEVSNFERTLRREQVIASTLVDYYLPDDISQPNELKLLQARNFRKVRFRSEIQAIVRSPGDVVILDLKNWVMSTGQKFSDLPEAEQQAPGKQLIQDLLDVLPESVVIVVYTRGRLFYLNEIGDRYVIAANNPVTLVGNVADGAYVVAGDRTIHQTRP